METKAKTKTKTKTDEAPREHKKPWQETCATVEEIKAMVNMRELSAATLGRALMAMGFESKLVHGVRATVLYVVQKQRKKCTAICRKWVERVER